MTLTPVRDPALGSLRQKLALALIVCLPVPALAGSGLAIPLPSVVYRVAVAFAERSHEIAVRIPGLGAVVDESSDVLRAGTIRLSSAEVGPPDAVVTGSRGASTPTRGRDRGDARAAAEPTTPAVAVDGPRQRPADGSALVPRPAGRPADEQPAPTRDQPAPVPTTTTPTPTPTPPPSGGGETPTTPTVPALPSVPPAPELPNPGGVVPELPAVPKLPDPTSPGGVDLPSVPSLP